MNMVFPLAALLGSPVALAGNPDIAQVYNASGSRAAYETLTALVAETSPKKIGDVLSKSGLGRVEMRVALKRGADLSLQDPTPVGACAWQAGTLTCGFQARASAPGDYRVSCMTTYGAWAPVEASVTDTGGMLQFAVRGLETCWKLDAVGVMVEPMASTALEGVGQGTEFIPPELVELDKREVDEMLHANAGNIQICVRRASEEGKHVAGNFVIGYHIGADGAIDKAWVDAATTHDEAIEACMLERFRRIRIRPPMGGFEGGTFTFTFL